MYNFFSISILPCGEGKLSQELPCRRFVMTSQFFLCMGKWSNIWLVLSLKSLLCNRQSECMTWWEMVSTWALSCWNSVWLSCWPKWWFSVLFPQLQIVSVLYKFRISTASTHILCLCTDSMFSAISREANWSNITP